MERSLHWDGDALVAVDQRALPGEYRTLRLDTVDAVIDAISTLAVRGAPAIGVAGAFAVAIAARRDGDLEGVLGEARRVVGARPTAVNLAWAVERVVARVGDGADAVLDEALALLDADEQTNRGAASRAADAVLAMTSRRPLRVLTHCNTGRLATTAWGTALGAIRELHAGGHVEQVLAGETRPLLQGARLTAWELAEAGIPHRLCVDSAGPAAIAAGDIDCVLVGADRVTRDGDVANKIGTYSLALAAKRAGIPFVVVAPESTVDESIADGSEIRIEQRSADEVTHLAGQRIAPEGCAVFNPAFDVTPADLITAIVTETRVISPAQRGDLVETARELYRRGWLDGTAGNLSVRVAGHSGHALITASGLGKGSLTAADLVTVDADTGNLVGARPGLRPSAETSIHAAIYRTFPDCGAVVHAHPPHATALAAMTGPGTARFADFEIIKGFGIADPSRVDIPVLANHPHVPDIADELADLLRPDSPPVMLIAHHGATAWGPDLQTARNRLECLEALCRLHLLTGGDAR